MKKPLQGFTSIRDIILARQHDRDQSLGNSGDAGQRFLGLVKEGRRFAAPQRLSVRRPFFTDEMYLALHDRANWANIPVETKTFAARYIERCRKIQIPMFVANVTYNGVQISHAVVGAGYTSSENLFLWHVFKEVQQKLAFEVHPIKTFGQFGLFYLPEVVEPKALREGELRRTPRALLAETKGH